MFKSVRDAFFDYTVNKEGFTPYLYADTLNLVTTGVGNLVDAGPNFSGNTSVERARLNNIVSAAAMAPALSLPWKMKGAGWKPTADGITTNGDASRQNVIDAWTAVKQQNQFVPDFSQRGGGAYQNLTPLTLTMQDMRDLFNRTLNDFDSKLSVHFPGYESFPADAQFALLSMAWAMGPNFNFPQLKSALDKRDFQSAIPLSFFKGGGGTPDKPTGRNADNQIMFATAATVERLGADSSQLYFPGTSSSVRAPIIANAAALIRMAETSGAILATAGLGYGVYRWWSKR